MGYCPCREEIKELREWYGFREREGREDPELYEIRLARHIGDLGDVRTAIELMPTENLPGDPEFRVLYEGEMNGGRGSMNSLWIAARQTGRLKLSERIEEACKPPNYGPLDFLKGVLTPSDGRS